MIDTVYCFSGNHRVQPDRIVRWKKGANGSRQGHCDTCEARRAQFVKRPEKRRAA